VLMGGASKEILGTDQFGSEMLLCMNGGNA
jgi:hypothetical protein